MELFAVCLAESVSDIRFQTREEKKKIPGDRETFTSSDLSRLPELHPPTLMPQGNVGTPTSHFLCLIQQCRLPASIISKLGLVFPRTRSNRKYGSVPFEYGGKTCPGVEDGAVDVKSGGGTEIMSERELENVQRYEASLPPRSTADEQQDEDNDSESDADDCEEWERHEAFYNDPSNHERNKERLYESEMEIVWEKGGPGIVWYTDAQFWDELEGRKSFLLEVHMMFFLVVNVTLGRTYDCVRHGYSYGHLLLQAPYSVG